MPDFPVCHIAPQIAEIHPDFGQAPSKPRRRAMVGEIVFALAMAKGGRINSRMVGLFARGAKAEDGCR